MKLRNESILVTGAAGFIGSNLVQRLLDSNNRVIGYDNFDNYYVGKEKNIAQYLGHPNFTLVKSDILDFERLSAAMKDVNFVFHLAAQPGVRFSAENPWKTSSTNVEGTLNILLAAERNKIERVVFASSSAVYGEPSEMPCSESQPTSPLSVYGVSKLAGEDYCLTFFRSLGLPVVMLRYHTVYGPRQRPDMAIYKFTKALFEGKSPIVYGDGEQTRDFTYVNDVVEGSLLAAEKEEAEGQVFNIGGGCPVTVNNVIKLLTILLGKEDTHVIYQDEKPGDARHTYADIRKAMDLLGYKPKTKIEDGLEEFVKWFRTYRLSQDSANK